MMELYDAYPAVKENLDARFAQDKAACNAKLLEKYKKIIQDEYFPSKGEEKCRISVPRAGAKMLVTGGDYCVSIGDF